MIELVSESRCTQCNICVAVCPTNVFQAMPDAPPIIARQADCQTCFMCELYCPVDALFVAHDADNPFAVDEAQLTASAALGSYRKAIGWTPGSRTQRGIDQSFKLTDPR
jgi:NAD-dependent dihydropyrimidine dehydrogenase PreA subunit